MRRDRCSLTWRSRSPTAGRRWRRHGQPAVSRRRPERRWLELALAAADLLTWTKALCLKGTSLARAEPATLRYRLLHVGALVTDKARRRHLKIDRDWPWATDLATAFTRLRAAFD